MLQPSDIANARFARISELWAALDSFTLNRVGEEFLRVYAEDAIIYLLGNGGSASTFSHMSCDLNKSTISGDHRRLRVVSLTDNMAWFSAIANDHAFSEVFVEQLRTILRPGDLVLAISASGNSENVVRAVEFARSQGVTSIAFTGMTGGRLRKFADLCLHFEGGDYGTLEDIHLMLNHTLVEFMRTRIASADNA